MRSPLAWSVVALLALAAIVFSGFRSSRSVDVAPTNSHALPIPAEPIDEAPALDDDPAEPSSESESRTTATTSDANGAAERGVLIGRLVDDAHRPIPNLKLQLQSGGGAWSTIEDAPLIPGRTSARGFEATSDANGTFRFDVPRRDERALLTTTRTLYVEQLRRSLSQGVGAGTTDLGDIVLRQTGAIAGRVHRADGRPVAKAALHAYTATGQSDENGEFVVANVQEGLVTLQVSGIDCIAFERRGIVVHNGATTSDIDVLLDDAPKLTGRVVDASGAPIANAEVISRPITPAEGFASTTRTKPDGTFELLAEHHGRRTIMARCERYFDQRLNRAFDENTRDIQIVMQPSPQVTFRVVDAASGVPCESYAIEIVDEAQLGEQRVWAAGQPARKHPNGEVTLNAIVGAQFVRVGTDRQVFVETRIVFDVPTIAVQTIRLPAGGGITGRITIGGKPPNAATLILRHPFTKINPSAPDLDDEARASSAAYHSDSSAYSGDTFTISTRSDGTFRVDHVLAGTWEILVRGREMVATVSAPVLVVDGATSDLGTIDISLGGSVAGRVICPANREAFVRLRLDDLRNESISSDSIGRFRIDGLTRGRHTLHALPTFQSRTGALSREFDVVDGATTELVLDLREVALAHVRVHATREGRPAASVRIEVENELGVPPVGSGKTSNEGLVDMYCTPGVPISIVALDPHRLVMARSEPRVFVADERADVDLAITSGVLEIQLPDSMPAMPDNGCVHVAVQRGNEPEITLDAKPPALMDFDSLEWSSRHIRVGEFMPGEYSVRVSADWMGINEHLTSPPRTRRVVVKTGQTAVITLD